MVRPGSGFRRSMTFRFNDLVLLVGPISASNPLLEPAVGSVGQLDHGGVVKEGQAAWFTWKSKEAPL